MDWKNVEINIQNIEYDSGKVSLIKMPNKSKYAGFKFWISNKLIRNGSNSYSINVSYNDTFAFKLIKNGKSKYTKYKLIDEIEISAEEWAECFDCMQDCTRAKQNDAYLIVKEPEKIEIDVKIDENLKNN